MGVGCVGVNELQDIDTPEEFDRLVAQHDAKEIAESLRVSADIDQHRRWIDDDLSLGFEAIYLHFVGGDIEHSIQSFSDHVLAKLS